MAKTTLVYLAIISAVVYGAATRKCYHHDYTAECLNHSNCSEIKSCESTTNYCFSAYEINALGNTKLRYKGCWSSSNDAWCSDYKKCQLRPQRDHPKYLFCCCAEDLCNSNNRTQIKFSLKQFAKACTPH
ncbi:uncharacterized protein [Montipora capricornis]|uniref:uncharacterized protein n=1 Tax=Montipora foliosa TaxID=591990 RepID=UPI0035F10AE4